ncbi:ATP-citrate synthase-like [Penaeus chinensis]|uniref:ATP-citrate synthase-like n=1 Tax=Penaeus chinensis TaxID=139456 RepID=UPI001FB5BC81|nr:ATP-citrate synthase-like [Penaeus chinensis]
MLRDLTDVASLSLQVGKAVGKLRTFIIEPFLPHEQKEEAYVCIYSHRAGDTILFTHEGGVDIGDVDAKALKLDLQIEDQLSVEQVKEKLLLSFVLLIFLSVKSYSSILYLGIITLVLEKQLPSSKPCTISMLNCASHTWKSTH